MADTFNRVQDVLGGSRRPRKKGRHAFMGLLTCAKCGCAITAEVKKGRYAYYHCTHFRGRCENTYIREEPLGALLATVIQPIQITPEIAEDIATAIRCSESDAARTRTDAVRHVD